MSICKLLDNNVDLSAGVEDIAMRIGAFPDSTAIATRLGAMRAMRVASPALLQQHRVPQHPGDLAKLPAVTLDIPASNPATKTRRAQARLSITNPTPPLLDLAQRGPVIAALDLHRAFLIR